MAYGVAQHQDLDILRRLGTDQQHQPARESEEDQIEQPQRHEQTIMHSARASVEPQISRVGRVSGTHTVVTGVISEYHHAA
ncbi:hypothetical protein [Nonomuraea africana]|uniref:hypothetical protein n=1 Tax=Nonomuraea africana TaxID=46171 RepID=UPI0033CFF2DA